MAPRELDQHHSVAAVLFEHCSGHKQGHLKGCVNVMADFEKVRIGRPILNQHIWVPARLFPDNLLDPVGPSSFAFLDEKIIMHLSVLLKCTYPQILL